MIRILYMPLLLCLTACGGGSSGDAAWPTTTDDTQELVMSQKAGDYPSYKSAPGCMEDATRLVCDLVPDDGMPVGIGVAAGKHVVFVNRTGTSLQLTQSSAYTGERQFWSEYCVYLNWYATGQSTAGRGEVGCAAKNINEDYVPINWGAGTGLVVPPNSWVLLNSHTVPHSVIHIYTLRVQYLDAGTGVQSWRQPSTDSVIPCNNQVQYTAMTPWRNNTNSTVYLGGGAIYSETPESATVNTVIGACVYVLQEGGFQKYANCDIAFRTKGAFNFPPVAVLPGEYVAAQAANVCPTGGHWSHWNWAAFLNVRMQ